MSDDSHPSSSSAGHSVALPIDTLLAPLQAFMQHTLAGAGLLMAATVAALIWANTGWAEVYHHLLHVPVTIAVGEVNLTKSVHHLINDGLMGIFFFLVGLEIKRELLIGELSTRRKAALPAIAAVGGMLVPAVLYVLVNPDEPARSGWGIPMATDIAFALGVLALLGDRVPGGLKVLLTALAIVDDIGAVLVIAIFYTDQVSMVALGAGLAGVTLSIVLSKAGVRNAVVYFALGTAVWLAFLQSGVHATIAALLMAFTIPARTRIDGRRLLGRMKSALAKLERVGPPPGTGLNTPEQQHVLDEIASVRGAASAPLLDLEHGLVPLVTFVILPVFALANAGVGLGDVGLASVTTGIGLGIVVGLVVGKTIGISLFTWLAVRLGVADLPQGVGWLHVIGIGLLGGIGFTMALFIGGLAFESQQDLDAAKVAILIASVIAATAGIAVLRQARPAGD